jgi:tetratricopeptide (TPR) repeat protein
LRTGNYNKGIAVNEQAVNSYQKTIPVYQPVTGNAFLYIIHNLHMQTNHSMMAGRSAYSAESARATVNSIPAEYLSTPGGMGNAIQYIYMTPMFTGVRFGNWNQLLATTEPAHDMIYARLLHHFGRGMALTAVNKTGEAKTELDAVRELSKEPVLTEPFTPFSPAIDGAFIAENLLAGSIALKEKQIETAIACFRSASHKEEEMVYNEPRDWLLNPKHYLGHALLKAGKPAEAIKVLESDLKNNHENGWALFGIWQALVSQNKKTEAARMLLRFKKAFEKSDVQLTGAVFD